MARGKLPLAFLGILILAGCKQSADIDVTGTIAGIQPGDSVFVTLSRDWVKGAVAPTLFNMDETGRFALRFTIDRNPPPVSFVKNGALLAEFELKKAWDYDPYLVEKASGRQFPVNVVAEGVLRAQISVGAK